MNYNYLSPYVRVAMDSIINPPWKLNERVIFDYELLFIKEGEVYITIEEDEYYGKPGSIFLFKPGQRHSIQITGNTRLRQPHLHFDLFYQPDSPDVKVSFKALDRMSAEELKLFRNDATTEPGMLLPNKLSLRNIEYFENMLFEIIREFEKKPTYYDILVKGLFLKLWAYLLRENNFSINPQLSDCMEEIEGIREYLRSNIEKEVSLDELSKKFKISKYHLSRIFKKAYGDTPIHYSRIIRMEKAKELIQYSRMSLTEISEALGFNSINTFSRTFRNIEGVPPSYYR